MSKYFWHDQGTVKDWRWVQDDNRWLFYLDETYIGSIHRYKRGDYSASGSTTPFPFPVRGFRTRQDAALFMLTWRDYKLKQGQWDIPEFSAADIEALEVKPEHAGTYRVTVFQHNMDALDPYAQV